MNKGLGRIHMPDANDKNFPIRVILPKRISLTSKYWYDTAVFLNQGNTPQCVAYSLSHWLLDGPVLQKAAIPAPKVIYKEAQELDEWPGSNYDGTSVRGGAKALQARGYISSYLWAWDLKTTIDAVLTKGPVVVGTNWYDDMFYPKNGVIKIGGSLAGGHAYCLNGVNTKTKMFRMKNSWGKSWGASGRASISFADVERLISEQGEVMLGVEVMQ